MGHIIQIPLLVPLQVSGMQTLNKDVYAKATGCWWPCMMSLSGMLLCEHSPCILTWGLAVVCNLALRKITSCNKPGTTESPAATKA